MENIIVGLTGGIGCGKTEVAKILEELGARIIDADAIGKQVVEEQSEVLQEMVKVFGMQFLNPDGSLKRKELGSFVFQDEKRKRQLNAIVHPYLWKRVLYDIEEAKKQNFKLIVVDAALIYETGLEKHFQKVIVVSSLLETRIARIRERDGFTETEIRDRIASQMPLEEKVRRADIVIENDGSLERLRKTTSKVFNDLTGAE
jgi:dephospho-CoA kinase